MTFAFQEDETIFMNSMNVKFGAGGGQIEFLQGIQIKIAKVTDIGISQRSRPHAPQALALLAIVKWRRTL